MAARANVAYDRLLAVVLCVLATCSRGDTVVRKKSVGSAREVRDDEGAIERQCGRIGGAACVWEVGGAREGGE
jgi:hypothetical protein